MKVFLKGATLALLVSSVVLAQTAESPQIPLDHLTGTWVLEGTIAGKQITHDVEAAWGLDKNYVQLHEVSRDRKLLGAWRVVSVETIRQSTKEIIYPWMGRRPTGMIVYLPNGYMAVQLMRDPPAKFASETYEGATLEESRDAFLAYYAYYGRYTIDEEKGMVTHHVESSLWPEEHGIEYTRFFTLDGDRLTLVTAPFIEGGEERINRLVWERMK